MIDWYSGVLGYSGEALKLNSVCEITPDGNTLWTSERKIQARGSFDASVQVGRSSPTAEMIAAAKKYGFECEPVCLYVSGNPSKFLQGHNVFGPSVSSLGPVVQAMVRGLPDGIRPSDADSPLLPAVHRTRVDITTSVDMGSDHIVHEWLHCAATGTRSRHGRAMQSGTTVYWGKGSSRWTMKAYCKFCEMKEHHPGDLALASELREYCEGHLRLELTLRTLELTPKGTLDEGLIWDYFNKIEVGIMKADVDVERPKAHLPMVGEYILSRWLNGEDVAHSVSRATFYRYRRLILDQLGLDISLSYEKKTAERVVFDVDYLKAHEIKIPSSSLQGRLFKPEPTPKWAVH